MKRKALTLVALSLTLASPAHAQKARTAPLHVYNAAGQALGQYTGLLCFSSATLPNATRAEICWQHAPDPEAGALIIMFETTDCSGTMYYYAFHPTIKSGVLFENGNVLYTVGNWKAINVSSYKLANVRGELVGDCNLSSGWAIQAGELRLTNVGAGPYTVK